MVHDAVWARAGMYSDGGFLCVGCLEKRLGRTLRPSDFTDAPINDLDNPWQTERLVSRKSPQPNPAKGRAVLEHWRAIKLPKLPRSIGD